MCDVNESAVSRAIRVLQNPGVDENIFIMPARAAPASELRQS